jgi:hypothetical protein
MLKSKANDREHDDDQRLRQDQICRWEQPVQQRSDSYACGAPQSRARANKYVEDAHGASLADT